MSNPEKKLDKDVIFALEKVFPDATGLFFSGYLSLADCFQDAIVVLDTNVLLMPFALGNQSVNAIKKVYEGLISENRLFVPERVAREFARLRTTKLAEIYASIQSKKTGKSKQDFNYPIIADLAERTAVVAELEKLKASEAQYFKAIDVLLDKIKSWEWADPVSEIYSSLFTASVFCCHDLNNDQLGEQLELRFKIKQPPGYKDAAKEDGGIGDLAIWLSVLELGKSTNKHVIFVSEEGKPDWWQSSGGTEFLPRYELVDEFRRSSNGKTIHIVKLSKLLELAMASKTVIEEAQSVEKRNAKFESMRQAFQNRREREAGRFKTLSKAAQKAEILQWFHSNYADPVEDCPFESREGGYQFIWGGPFDAREEVESEYGGIASDRLIDEIVNELNDICPEWSAYPEPDDASDYEDDDRA
ncbi:MAG TPA: PIN domain-containing protein [Arenimonas sp.]|nr:PIN domain-containing protein [Arenimonas sp.]